MSSPTCSLPVRSRSFDSWVERCQISVDRQADASVNGDTLLDLVASLPNDLSDQQQDQAGHLLARLFCRFVSTLNRRVVSDLARRALAGGAMSEWVTASPRLARLVVRAAAHPYGSRVEQTPPCTDARVARALAEIDRHFTNPRFGLRAAAGGVALSGCRLTHLLKATTGRTFGAHLHDRRIAEAQSLLNATTLSIKEIAGRVGYQSTTQLDRHFKRIVRLPPSAYRAMSRRRPEPTRGDDAVRPGGAKLTHTKQQK